VNGRRAAMSFVLWSLCPMYGYAQAPAAAAPSDAPSIDLGVTIFADYTVQQQPKGTDPTTGSPFTPNEFNIGRSYINVTGRIWRTVAFRITPDIARETGVGSALKGSYTFRLKYAYAQWNLDEHTTPGTYARFGMQPTPYVVFMDDIYRYRFQSTLVEEREGYLASSDAGATFHYNFPGKWGDLHGGAFNGETFRQTEVNDQKGWMVRGTVRPLANAPGALEGVRVTGFVDRDMYAKNFDRRRNMLAVTFEHQYVNAGVHYFTATDEPAAGTPQTTACTAARCNARGWSVWLTPRTTIGWEGLVRFDQTKPDTTLSGRKRTRTIAGVAYWFPHQGGVSTALLFDVDNTKSEGFSASTPTTVRRIGVHALVNY
jgi:hypothetical protein